MLFRDSRSIVVHFEHRFAAFPAQVYGNRTAVRRISYGVVEQIDQHLQQTVFITVHEQFLIEVCC